MDLTEWDWIVVNSSAGKDSQAMLHMVARAAERQGVLDRVVVVHCDLGRVEWQGTRELAEEHAEHYGVRFEVVRRPQGDLLEQVQARGMWPSSTARYCTSDQKRGQVRKVFTLLTHEWHKADWERMLGRKLDGIKTFTGRRVRILSCMGLRADESPARKKKPVLAFCESASNGKREVWDWLPIHAWTEEQVWEVIRRAGTRRHDAYRLGMKRLSCCFCIFAPRSALLRAGQHNRPLLDQYVQVEAEIGHRFRNDLTLASVRDALDRGEHPAQDDGRWNM